MHTALGAYPLGIREGASREGERCSLCALPAREEEPRLLLEVGGCQLGVFRSDCWGLGPASPFPSGIFPLLREQFRLLIFSQMETLYKQSFSL